MLIEFTCNGKPVAVEAPPDISLLTLLRDYMGLTGSKEGCSVGECGACAVIMDGRLINSCLILAPQAGGSEVITIEGVHAEDGGPNDMQENFIEYGAVQCGICIPGMVIAGEALLLQSPNPTRAEIRTALAGNLCRCTGYQQIIDAIEATAKGRASSPKVTPSAEVPPSLEVTPGPKVTPAPEVTPGPEVTHG